MTYINEVYRLLDNDPTVRMLTL